MNKGTTLFGREEGQRVDKEKRITGGSPHRECPETRRDAFFFNPKKKRQLFPGEEEKKIELGWKVPPREKKNHWGLRGLKKREGKRSWKN